MMFLIAVLYASAGHAGASGYLAIMALAGIEPALMKPAALSMNILVASIACWKFYRVGAFSWRLFIPLTLASMPFAYLGGHTTLPGHIYKPIVGVVLLLAAGRSFFNTQHTIETKPVSFPLLILSGGILGFLSGLIGIGGGILLSPLLLFLHWAEVRTIAGVTAAFTLVNSISGLLGVVQITHALPSFLPIWLFAIAIGGYLGAEFGSKHLNNTGLRKTLAVILVIAGMKMIFI